MKEKYSYSEALGILNRRSVKFAIKVSNIARSVRSIITSKDNNIPPTIDEKLSYTPNADPVRTWSNIELKKFSHLLEGDVVNISGWEDKDKDGGFYKDYFTKATSYTITNYSQHMEDKNDEIPLDLEKDLDPKLESKFDVVFNHTILEHIFESRKAYANMAKMTRDIIITVVPFIQQQHEMEGFNDYWRYTPTCLRYLAEENGLSIIYENYRRDPYEITYIISVASRDPKKWENKMPEFEKLSQIADWIG